MHLSFTYTTPLALSLRRRGLASREDVDPNVRGASVVRNVDKEGIVNANAKV
jgi:hypothetical protein